MKAIVQEGSGSADVLQLRDIDKPALTDDQVLIRVRAASVNALDWHTIHGGRAIEAIGFVMRQPPTFPIRGADVAGEIEAIGRNVTRFKPGDEVFGTGRGTFAEYATSREAVLVAKPRDLSFVQAAAIGVAGITALQGLRDKARVQPGQRVLISGAGGGVGTFALQIAKALGAHVTATTSTRNLDLVRSLGPDEVIDYTQVDFTRRGERFDVVFDVAAHRSLESLVRLLSPHGTLVLAGAAKGSTIGILGRILKARLLSRFVTRRLVFYVANVNHEDLLVLRELIESGKLRPVIDRTYPLAEAREAVRYLGSGQARAKVVINVAQGE